MSYLGNTVTVSGYIGADPVAKNTSSGKEYVDFSLAINKKLPSGEQKPIWLKVRAYGSTVDLIKKHVFRSSEVIVQGSIDAFQTRDQQQVLYILCSSFKVINSKKNNSTTEEQEVSVKDKAMVDDDYEEEVLPF